MSAAVRPTCSTRPGSKATGIEASSYATVAAVDASQNLLTVQKGLGEFITYDPRRIAGVSVFRETMHDFSVGDRIQFTAPDNQLGVANRDLAVIESISPDGRIAARLDDNRGIEFNAADHRHFDHGYAVTSHSSQGLTAERVLIHEATIFTDDAVKLSHQLGTEVTKTAALEIDIKAVNIIHDISIGV